MIDGINPHGPEATTLRAHLRKMIDEAASELEIPGQPVDRYDVLRGKLMAWRGLLRDLGALDPSGTSARERKRGLYD